MQGTSFKLLDVKGLDAAGPFPPQLNWKSPLPQRVGCVRTEWMSR